ncbi:MAG: HD domain-containing protein [Clostridiales bacterium]|nr:HD domain-containing protein [Clostridiales bacterium]
MLQTSLLITFIISSVLSLIYAMMWHKHFDVHFTLIFVFLPISILGTYMLSVSSNLEEALLANRILYLGPCFGVPFLSLMIFYLCRVNVNRVIKAILLLMNSAIYASVLLPPGTAFSIYDSCSFEIKDGTGNLIKDYGQMHKLFIIMLIVYAVMCLCVLTYAFFRKKEASRMTILLLFVLEILSTGSYFARRLFDMPIEPTPFVYVLGQLIILFIVYRIGLYDVNDSGIDSLVERGNTGFISFDYKLRYLGSNETAKKFWPEIESLRVDRSVEEFPGFKDTAVKWIHRFVHDESKNEYHFEKDGKNYQVDVNYLYDGRRRRGYQFFITDDTADQEYIKLISRYNDELNEEVEEKTRHIVKMHDNLILSMATMVESRDNSTGGHIRRTSTCVKLLIDEMKKDNVPELTDEFCKNVIKAAPMHDLGKIAVDDAVLRKPGKFTPEEFEKMKKHAPEGAKIVHEILKDTDDESFRVIAENVAHYHHERWDGSGYPSGLKGEQIPLEARIMAIADVYDALVSKRVYKERMSFEKADSIIMEGMGKHFDKGLEKYYVAARPHLEDYYRESGE